MSINADVLRELQNITDSVQEVMGAGAPLFVAAADGATSLVGLNIKRVVVREDSTRITSLKDKSGTELVDADAATNGVYNMATRDLFKGEVFSCEARDGQVYSSITVTPGSVACYKGKPLKDI